MISEKKVNQYQLFYIWFPNCCRPFKWFWKPIMSNQIYHNTNNQRRENFCLLFLHFCILVGRKKNTNERFKSFERKLDLMVVFYESLYKNYFFMFYFYTLINVTRIYAWIGFVVSSSSIKFYRTLASHCDVDICPSTKYDYWMFHVFKLDCVFNRRNTSMLF